LDKEKVLRDYYDYKLDHNLTQKEFGKEAKIHPSTISKITNHMHVREEVWYRLERFLKESGGKNV